MTIIILILSVRNTSRCTILEIIFKVIKTNAFFHLRITKIQGVIKIFVIIGNTLYVWHFLKDRSPAHKQ